MILDVTLIDLNAKSYADMWSFSKKMRKPKVNHKFYKLNWKKLASFRPQWQEEGEREVTKSGS